jgi:hypothetical protein
MTIPLVKRLHQLYLPTLLVGDTMFLDPKWAAGRVLSLSRAGPFDKG